MPVVERGDKLVGAFTHAALQRALAIEQPVPAPNPALDTLVGIAGAYWFGVSALIVCAAASWIAMELMSRWYERRRASY